jgi:hypothetical protein
MALFREKVSAPIDTHFMSRRTSTELDSTREKKTTKEQADLHIFTQTLGTLRFTEARLPGSITLRESTFIIIQ